MLRGKMVMGITVTLTAFATHPGVGQATPLTLPHGSEVRVRGTGLGTWRGRVEGVDAQSLVVRTADSVVTLPLPELSLVERLSTASSETAVGMGTVGLLVGAGLGALLSVGLCDAAECRVSLDATLAVGAVFGGMGLLSGAILGAFAERWERVYP